MTGHGWELRESYIRWALSQAKRGAMVLFNDNNDSRFYGWFDELASSLNFETLLSSTGEQKIWDKSERKDVIGHFAEKFNFRPKLQGSVARRVLRKR